MKKIRSIKIRPKFAKVLKIIGVLLCIVLGIFLFYRKQIYDLKKIGYSEIASKKILFSKNKKRVLAVGENQVLNLAFEGEDYQEDNFDRYVKIKYIEQDKLIENINKLIKIGYSNSDINIILSHGDSQAVSDFAKRDKVRYLEEYFSVDFAKLENYDRYVAYSDETGIDEYDTIIYVNLDLDKEDYQDAVLVDEFSSEMLVNKHRGLSSDFVVEDLTEIDSKYTSEEGFYSSRLALNAFIKMYQDALKEDYHLVINSAYRSFEDQVELIDFYRNAYGQSYVDKYMAKEGFSEHQTGLAYDIGSRNSRIFAESKEYQWMQDNAYKYGFILRYDKRYEDLTGFRNEPWHYRYVGKKIAKYIHEHNNMSLEEYYVLFLNK